MLELQANSEGVLGNPQSTDGGRSWQDPILLGNRLNEGDARPCYDADRGSGVGGWDLQQNLFLRVRHALLGDVLLLSESEWLFAGRYTHSCSSRRALLQSAG